MIRWHIVLWGVAAVFFLTAAGLLVIFPSIMHDPSGEGATYVIGYGFFGLVAVLAGSIAGVFRRAR